MQLMCLYFKQLATTLDLRVKGYAYSTPYDVLNCFNADAYTRKFKQKRNRIFHTVHFRGYYCKLFIGGSGIVPAILPRSIVIYFLQLLVSQCGLGFQRLFNSCLQYLNCFSILTSFTINCKLYTHVNKSHNKLQNNYACQFPLYF